MTNPSTSAGRPDATTAAGSVTRAFATPVARVSHPLAADLNPSLAELVLSRLGDVDNKFSYKAETAADMVRWQEPTVDALTRWVLAAARQFVESMTGRSLNEAFAAAAADDRQTYNSSPEDPGFHPVSIVPTRSWASVYRNGDSHAAHYHPNTAIAAIYYVESPGLCELDLLDPRPNIDFFDPGLHFADEGRTLRLHCEPGELILIPGWLKHAVPTFEGESLRISLSWNLAYSRRPTVTG